MSAFNLDSSQPVLKKTMRTLSRTSRNIVLIPVFLILILSFFFMYQSRQMSILNRQLQSTSSLLILNAEALKEILDMETGLRGYLLTGNEQFFDPFNSAAQEVPNLLQKMADEFSPQSIERIRVEQIKLKFDEWVDYAKRLKAMRVKGRGFNDLKINLEEKNAVDSIRDGFRQIRNDQITQLAAKQDEADHSSQRLMLWAGISAFLLAITLAFHVSELKVTTRALQESIKARDGFISIAGHELKTPLTSLQLQIQLRQRDLKRSYPESFTLEKLEESFEEQIKYVTRISRLIDDILDVARLTEGKLVFQFGEFDLCEMVTDVIKRFKVTADAHGVDVRFESCEPVHGYWDRFRIEQVLLNLLSNALRYGKKRPIHVRVEARGKNAILSVKDEGIGIKVEDQPRIFQRFERAISENEVSGLGLGLFISNEISLAHGGSIQVKSEPGKGAEFTVILPRARGVGEQFDKSQ